MGGWSFILLFLLPFGFVGLSFSSHNVDKRRSNVHIEEMNTVEQDALHCLIKEHTTGPTLVINVTNPNTYCYILLQCGRLQYSVIDLTGFQNIKLPTAINENNDNNETEVLRSVYNGKKFAKFLYKKGGAESHGDIIAFYYFYLPDNTFTRNQAVIDKIKACMIKLHPIFVTDGSTPTCVDGKRNLLNSISNTNIGECEALWMIRKDICLKLRQIGLLESGACDGLDFVKNTEPIGATTSESNLGEQETSATVDPTETTTTTHNPYVGNYLSKEAEAKRIKSIKNREVKSDSSMKVPKRQQEIATELILTIIVLVVMGAFSASVILYNGLIMDSVESASYEDVSEEEEDEED